MTRLLSFSLSAALGITACGGSHASENAKAKARIFAPVTNSRPPEPPRLDVSKLEKSPDIQDAVLGMSETELWERVGSFRQHAKLDLSFSAPGRTVTIAEERLVEQSKSGDLHLRILEGTGASNGGGMEVLSVDGKVYGRSRYGPYVLRDRQSGLAEQRQEVSGALATLYGLADRGLSFHELGAGAGCTRFAVALGTARPVLTPPRFNGRLDADTAKRFQFVYGRRMSDASGEICVAPSGTVTQAHLRIGWVSAGDAGSGEARAELEETLTDVGEDVHLARPEGYQPEPHRPRGPFDTLDRFGFVHHADGGEE